MRALAIVCLLCLALAACGPAKDGGRRTPSGFPVPRYLSLKYGEVNARAGPSEESRLLWVYRARGLPLQVVAETSDWRRICDPDGGLAWVHKRGVDGVRTVMRTRPGALPLLAQPKPGARTSAYLNARSVAAFQEEEAGWVKLKADGVSGWAPIAEVWGAAPGPQCRAAPPG